MKFVPYHYLDIELKIMFCIIFRIKFKTYTIDRVANFSTEFRTWQRYSKVHNWSLCAPRFVASHSHIHAFNDSHPGPRAPRPPPLSSVGTAPSRRHLIWFSGFPLKNTAQVLLFCDPLVFFKIYFFNSNILRANK